MSATRRLIFIIYDGFEILDLCGPMSVFTTANNRGESTLYEVVAASSNGGLICSSSGVSITSQPLSKIRFKDNDTVLVVGANRRALLTAAGDINLLNALKLAAKKSERYGSICSGAFIIGAAGLLEKRACSTHWAGIGELSRRFGNAAVDRESLYVTDGRLWTSAGATTGIDMALSMLQTDHGNTLMGLVAKWLVVYAHRPGHQSQFSLLLSVQTAADGEFSPLIEWVTEALDQPIKVSDMAEKVCMSQRTFYRKFTHSIGVTPSKFLETLRLQKARELLEAGNAVKAVFTRVGFRSEAAFRKSFKARFGVTPSIHSAMFQNAT